MPDWVNLTTIVLALVGLFVFLTFLGGFFTVQTAEAAVVQRFGRFARVATAGLNFKTPWIERVAGRLSLRVEQLDLKMETKTKDNVFVTIPISVQYQVIAEKVYDAFYRLTNPQNQITAYVEQVILGYVPKHDLDAVYESQNEIASAVQQELEKDMATFGYRIVKALVTDVVPDASVRAAMNNINAQRRNQEAANAQGEAERILVVKKAQAEAESKKLQGEGIANQRKAIIAGLQESVELFQKAVEGARAQDVLNLVVLTQYLDTLKEIGASAHTNTILVPHSPGTLGRLREEIASAVGIGELLGRQP
jgi:regulator of protease activity HflC (stomatin/prohibitin superfamily)